MPKTLVIFCSQQIDLMSEIVKATKLEHEQLDLVVILCNPESLQAASQAQNILDIPVSLLHMSNSYFTLSDSVGLINARDELTKAMESILNSRPADQIIVDLTAGTKLHSLMLYIVSNILGIRNIQWLWRVAPFSGELAKGQNYAVHQMPLMPEYSTLMRFELNQAVRLEETRYYEFKEIKGDKPVDSIKNTADEYVVAFLNSGGGRIFWGIRNADRVVAGVRLSYADRDELRRVITEKLNQIQPAIAPSAYRVEVHPVLSSGRPVSDVYVIEISVPRPLTNDLYFTASSQAFVKTDGGKKKLTGPEIQDEIRRRLQSSTTRIL